MKKLLKHTEDWQRENSEAQREDCCSDTTDTIQARHEEKHSDMDRDMEEQLADTRENTSIVVMRNTNTDHAQTLTEYT